MTKLPKKIDNTTLVCVDCQNHGAAIAAIKKSLVEISVDKVIFFTDREFKIEGIDVIIIPRIKSKDEYSYFLIKELYKYISTYYVLTIQHDGWVLNGDAWDDEFYNYDYIGAKWLYIDHRNVGNGAFSWRSKKLLDSLGLDTFIEITPPEDEIIGRLYRKYLETNYDIRFASEKVADKFSFELNEPCNKTFGFHGWFWPPFQETVMVKRTGAMGDVIQVQPILEYFHKKGYRVVLDTLPEFFELFRNHYFPIHFKPAFNPNIPYTEYNLDMSYETDPKKLHLQAYYDFCDIPKEEQIIKNPKLAYVADGPHKLFKKYAVIHIDEREQASRNVYGVDWNEITTYLASNGYTPIQIGKNKHEDTGAIYMSTITQDLLAYLICGCDLFIGVDSGPSHIAVATGRKCILFFGSVSPALIHPDLSNIKTIYNVGVCDKPFCWHETIGTTGTKCYIDDSKPPCTSFLAGAKDVLKAINELL